MALISVALMLAIWEEIVIQKAARSNDSRSKRRNPGRS
jgi:hypothetical protein